MLPTAGLAAARGGVPSYILPDSVRPSGAAEESGVLAVADDTESYVWALARGSANRSVIPATDGGQGPM